MRLVKCRECGEIKGHEAKGLCKNCYGRVRYRNDEGFRELRSEYNRRWYKKNREREIENVRRWQEKNREKGLCAICGRPIDYFISRVRCPVCHFKHLDRTYKRSIDLVSRGLCPECGKRPLYTKWRCRECNEKHNKRMRLYGSGGDISGLKCDLELASDFVVGVTK